MRRRQATLVVLLTALAAAAPLAAQRGALDDYVAEAVRANLGLTQARLAAARSDAAVAEARSRFLPSLSVHARYSEARGVVNLGDLVNPAYRALNELTGTARFPTDVDAQLPFRQETTLRLAQPLFDPAIVEHYRVARSVHGVQREQVGAAARQLAADVQHAYLDHARAVRVAELYVSTLQLVEENVRVNERLLAAGKVTPDALFRARAERSDVVQQLASAEQRRSAAQQYFNLLLDRPLDAVVEPAPDSALVPAEPVTLEHALARARAGREELRQAEHDIDIAESQRRLARASWLPTVAVAVDWGIQGSDYRVNRDSDFAIASLVLQWQAFNGGRDAARHRQATHERSRARTAREAAEKRIAQQVETSHRALDVARQAIATASDRVTAAQRTFELVARRYEQGLAAQIEYIDARAAYTSAELNHILTIYDHAARWVDLERAAALRDDITLTPGERVLP